jgi:hypothetical protein
MCLYSILDMGQHWHGRVDIACQFSNQGPQQHTLLECGAKERETRYPARMGEQIGSTY